MLNKAKKKIRDYVRRNASDLHDRTRFQVGELLTYNIRNIQPKRFEDVEFRVFSQYGQDGIIQYLISEIPNLPQSFVEFGVQRYAESSTRFLLQKWNWAGLIIDGDDAHIKALPDLRLSWQHDIECVQQFLTTDNINDVIGKRFKGDLGLLVIDVDGMEYWLWNAINVISPAIVVLEYNSAYGDQPVSPPYNARHSWDEVDRVFFYNNASLASYKILAAKKGYTFIGCDSSGTDSFFVRNDLAHHVKLRGDYVRRKSYWNLSGAMFEKYCHLPLINVVTNETYTVREFFQKNPLSRTGKVST